MIENVVVIGATSGIARPLATRLAARGWHLVLAGRDPEELDRMATDLQIRFGQRPATFVLDVLDYGKHSDLIAHCQQSFAGTITGVVYCVGYMTDQSRTETDSTELRRTVDVNLTSCMALLMILAAHLERQQRGWLAVISSVAGDRGRQSNYTYGAAKAGLSAFLSGLRNRLHRAGVHVLTIKPGPVDTEMIAGHLNPNSWQVSTPENVAAAIERAIIQRKDVAYVPWFWRPIMTVICSIPERIFKRLKL